MSANIQKILVIGGTSGIGEALARALHVQSKQVILTGRRKARLDNLRESLPGTTTYHWDICELSQIDAMAKKILADHPDLDTVWINAGIPNTAKFTDSSFSDTDLINTITTNFTAPTLLIQAFMPHLVSRAKSSKHAALMVTSSGLAFTPAAALALYCATKAAIHSLMVGVRQQVAKYDDANVAKCLSICELVPPFTATAFQDATPELPGAMPLDEFTNIVIKKLGEGDGSGKLSKEIAAGTAEPRVKAWRDAIGPIMQRMGGVE